MVVQASLNSTRMCLFRFLNLDFNNPYLVIEKIWSIPLDLKNRHKKMNFDVEEILEENRRK